MFPFWSAVTVDFVPSGAVIVALQPGHEVLFWVSWHVTVPPTAPVDWLHETPSGTHWLLTQLWLDGHAAQDCPLLQVYGTNMWLVAVPQVPVTCWHEPGTWAVPGMPPDERHACESPHCESIVQQLGAVHCVVLVWFCWTHTWFCTVPPGHEIGMHWFALHIWLEEQSLLVLHPPVAHMLHATRFSVVQPPVDDAPLWA